VNASEDARDWEHEGIADESPSIDEEEPGGEGGVGQLPSHPAPPNPSNEWKKSKLKIEDILTLVKRPLIRGDQM
jgi:hypothetical protein